MMNKVGFLSLSSRDHRPGHGLALSQRAEAGAEGIAGHTASGRLTSARASRRRWPGLNWWGAAMADAKLRKQRMRARRQQAGLKGALVWLSPEGQAAMAALRQPGETIDTFVNRALVTLQAVMANGTSPDTCLSEGAGAALVALLRVLLPEGERRYLRDCGITTLPLAHLNAVLAPLGYVIRGTKTRSAARFVLCTDALGQVERYGLFALQRVAESR
jgi:hypothetical protein